MSLQTVWNSVALATIISISTAPLSIVTPLLAQTINTDPLYKISDNSVAEFLANHDCAILTKQGFIIIPDNSRADTDGDGRAERFCTPGFVHRIEVNEYFSQTDLLTRPDDDKTRVVQIYDIISSRQITPNNYYVVISKTGTVNEANVIDMVRVSEDEAKALENEIERTRAIEVGYTPQPAPAPPRSQTLPPAPAPAPAPAPQVQPAPQPVPALW